ncbi:MAG: response regulator transcription factor [Chloroflexi bacterium]|nr:response regulator transcription factor [Chloroflexota bacterium]
MDNGGVRVVVVGKPGPVRDGLCALLTAIPQIDLVDQADNLQAALPDFGQRRPALVVIDSDVADNDIVAMLLEMRTGWPDARCVAFADDPGQQRAAKAAGASAALLKGARAAEIVNILECLLYDKQGAAGEGHN